MHIKRVIIYAIPAFVLFALVRFYQHSLFYDPFTNFFEGGMSEDSWPTINLALWISNLLFRFALNALIGIAFIHFVFRKPAFTWLSTKIYVVSGLVATLAAVILCQSASYNDYFLFFFVRRLIIHPIIFFILIPALIYQEQLNKENH